MKKAVFIFFICTIILSCKNTKELSLDQQKELTAQIDQQLTDWHNAAGKANYKNYFRVLDDKAVYIGTDAAEVWNKEQFSAFSKPYFDKGKAWSFTALNRNIYFSKSCRRYLV